MEAQGVYHSAGSVSLASIKTRILQAKCKEIPCDVLADFGTERDWLKEWMQNQTNCDVIALSGNSHHSRRTLPFLTSFFKSFHCVSFAHSFCYSTCIKDFSFRKLWLYSVLSCGNVCGVFRATSTSLVFSPSRYWNVYSAGPAVHAR